MNSRAEMMPPYHAPKPWEKLPPPLPPFRSWRPPALLCLLLLSAPVLPCTAAPQGAPVPSPSSPPAPPPSDAPVPNRPPPPPFPGSRDRDRDREHDRGPDRSSDWRGGMPGYGRPPMHSDSFDKLPEEEKRRIRAAFDKVWSRPEVIEARDRSMRANEELRDTIRATLGKIDPGVVAILDRVQPKDHFDPRQLPKLPPADSAEFPRAMVLRLGMEMLAFSKPERREETRRFHERIILLPQVKEAISRLESTQGEARMDAMQKLREAYRDAVGAEFKAARERRAAEGKDEHSHDKDKDKDKPREGGLPPPPPGPPN